MNGDSYAKVYGSLLTSTVWCEAHPTRIVWITMLAMADAKGRVHATIPGLAALARVTLEECEHAIERFAAPDKYSRTEAHDGRRIEKIDGGWLLLNYQKYREGRDPEARREQNREAAQRYRERARERKPASATVSQRQPESAQAEAEAEEATASSLRSEAVEPAALTVPVVALPVAAKPSKAARTPSAAKAPPEGVVYEPSPALRGWAERERPDLDIGKTVERFNDYRLSTGKRYANLDAAFRNWVRGERAVIAAPLLPARRRAKSIAEQVRESVEAEHLQTCQTIEEGEWKRLA